MNISEAIQQRHACRAFLDTPVPEETIRHILSLARWAPSGVNSQPWQVAVARGQTRQDITDSLLEASQAGEDTTPDYAYYPDEWVEPYKNRRIVCGKALYGALQIERGDREAQKTAWENNYRFFGAQTALFIFIDRAMNQGSWVDTGMFIQNILLAACESGLATCPQASLADYPDRVRRILDMPDSLALICGISIGYPDTHQLVNQYRLPREPVDQFTRWYD